MQVKPPTRHRAKTGLLVSQDLGTPSFRGQFRGPVILIVTFGHIAWLSSTSDKSTRPQGPEAALPDQIFIATSA